MGNLISVEKDALMGGKKSAKYAIPREVNSVEN